MADSIEMELRELVAFVSAKNTDDDCAKKCLGFIVRHGDELATRLRALSPAGGDWVMVPRAELVTWRAALSEEQAAYFPDTLQHIEDAASAIDAMLSASPQQEPGADGALADESIPPHVDEVIAEMRQEQDRAHLGRFGHRVRDWADRLSATHTPEEHDPGGQTLAGAGGDGECPLCSAPVKIWRDHRDGRGNEYEYVAPRSTQVMAAGAPTAQKPLDESANNAGVATGSRNDSPSESVTRGSLPPLTTATSAGTTGDDSEDAERFRFWLSAIFNGEHDGMFDQLETSETPEQYVAAIDAARRARGES